LIVILVYFLLLLFHLQMIYTKLKRKSRKRISKEKNGEKDQQV